MSKRERLKVALFSGGRGTGSISDALLKYPDIDLTVLVNAYDDGLSTGQLRRFIPGMLGPSDIRKVVSRILAHQPNPSSQALQTLLEYRFSDPTDADFALTQFRTFADLTSEADTTEALFAAREQLSLHQLRTAAGYLTTFLAYYEQTIEAKPWFTFSDTSLGNFLFAGCYLEHDQDFNAAIDAFCVFAGITTRVLNVTKGENLVLVGLKENGRYLADEASIVGPQSDEARLDEVFLLPQYLADPAHELPPSDAERVRYLRKRETLPRVNPAAARALREADVIVYGPGTQYSSLFPSYLTIGLGEAIEANAKAEKVFIANIARDYDLAGVSATGLVDALIWHLNRKGKRNVRGRHYVSRFFFQRPERVEAADYLPFEAEEFARRFPLDRAIWIDWEGASGKHAGGRTASELLLIVESQLQKKIRHQSHKVSIIIPTLNEAPTIKRVLDDVRHLQFTEAGLDKEIIVVDGGSTDGTRAIAERELDIRTYALEDDRGRGAALRLGIEKARGEIIVFFPSDAEYRASDIPRIVGPIMNHEFPVVFGSRAFRSTDLSGTLQHVYGNKGFLSLLSRYGGMTLSMLILFLYHRYVGDPLTTVKGFNARIFRKLNFQRNGVDFDMELIAKIAREGYSILEVPVSYTARTIEEGKKITVWDGIMSALTLLRLSGYHPTATPTGNTRIATLQPHLAAKTAASQLKG